MSLNLKKTMTRPAIKRITDGWAQPVPYADWRNRARARLALEDRDRIRKEQGEHQALDLLDWCRRYRSIDGQPFSLERFRPLEQIYRDDHPNKVIIKPAQVGVSEFAINLTVWAMVAGYHVWNQQKRGLNVGYLFPTQTALRDFSKERFSGLKRENEYLAALFADSEFDDVGFKQIADSYLYLRGAWSVEALLSFPADLLIFDEYDRMDSAAIELGRKRVRQSSIKREVCISTPTLPEVGIHARYMASDQHCWEVLCDRCNQHRELDYFRDVRADGQPYEVWRDWNKEKVVVAEWSVCCPNCRAEIDRLGPGRWRAKRPEVTTLRGYHVPALCFPAISLEELGTRAVSKDPTVLTEFYRSDLGLPYTAEGSRLTDDMLLKLFADLPGGRLPESRWHSVTMGVDVGSLFNYWIEGTDETGRRCCLAAGAVESWDRVAALMNQHKVVQCVVDARPEEHAAKQFAERFKGRVKRAFYPNGMAGDLFRVSASSAPPKTRLQRRAAKQLGGVTDDVPPDVVRINRTMAMDANYDRMAGGDLAVPEQIIRQDDIRKQLCAPVRVTTRDSHGQPVASWEHTTPDDYFHASVYCMIALAIMPRRLPGVLGQAKASGWNPSR